MRAWLEDASETGLRARITQTLDVSSYDQIVLVTASAEEVCNAVRAWLEAFVNG